MSRNTHTSKLGQPLELRGSNG